MISEPYYPEQQAWIDGQSASLFRTNLAFTVLLIGAGSHRVELKIIPTSFHVGVGVASATLLIWASVVVVIRLRERIQHPRDAERAVLA